MGGDHKPCFRHSRPSLFLKFTSCSESRCTCRQEGHPSNSARAAHQHAANAGLHLLLLLLFPRRRSNNKARCRNVDSVAFLDVPIGQTRTRSRCILENLQSELTPSVYSLLSRCSASVTGNVARRLLLAAYRCSLAFAALAF